jgi:hypothetical protein
MKFTSVFCLEVTPHWCKRIKWNRTRYCFTRQIDQRKRAALSKHVTFLTFITHWASLSKFLDNSFHDGLFEVVTCFELCAFNTSFSFLPIIISTNLEDNYTISNVRDKTRFLLNGTFFLFEFSSYNLYNQGNTSLSKRSGWHTRLSIF